MIESAQHLHQGHPVSGQAGMAWTQPQFTRERLNAAARALVADIPEPEDFDLWIDWLHKREGDLTVVNNWRSSHSYPLSVFQMTLRRYARKVDEAPLIAQRIKRLASITVKLQRFPNMKMSQMQDIGGLPRRCEVDLGCP